MVRVKRGALFMEKKSRECNNPRIAVVTSIYWTSAMQILHSWYYSTIGPVTAKAYFLLPF